MDIQHAHHRRAHLRKKPSSITFYRLPTKENECPFSVFQFAGNNLLFLFSVCRKQIEVAIFYQFFYPFEEFEISRHGHGDMERWRWRHGDIETWRHQMENGSLGDFPSSVYRLLIVQTEVCCLSVC
jgi:hypothetical protein